MKLLEVTSAHPDTGEHHVDWNKVLELAIKLAGIAGIIVGVWATKQNQKQKQFLDHQFSPEYVDSVEQKGQ